MPSTTPRSTPRTTASARDQLIEQHLGLVHHVAGQVSRSLSLRADFDELVSCGTLGLIGAIENFDVTRGLAFSTFAAPRIRGAILDELRKLDHVPRSVRRKGRDIARAKEHLIAQHGRPPMPRELASHLGVDLTTLWQWEGDVHATNHLSLDGGRAADQTGDDWQPMPDVIAHDEAPGADDLLDHEMEVERLRDAILSLKHQERTVLTLYYFENLKLHEIAAVLGVTESRISQIRTKALSRLRETLVPVAAVA